MQAGFSGSLLTKLIPVLGALFLAAIIVILCIRNVPPDMIYVIERNSRYFVIWESGVHILIPFQDKIVRMIPKSVQQKEFPLERLITKDECMLYASARMSYHISDFQHTSDGGDPHSGAKQLYEYTLREMAKHMKADEMTAEKAEMERLLRNALQNAYPRLGITLDSLELTMLRRI